MHLTVITGLSGAGRTSALKTFEDIGYFCADNIPPILIPELINIVIQQPSPPENIAVVADLRMGKMFEDIYDTINVLKNDMNIEVDILFLDAANEVLLSRFEQTRRSHPVSSSGLISAGIYEERVKLQRIKEIADFVLDTSAFNLKKLSDAIEKHYLANEIGSHISIVSFGYKRGIPLDVDIMFDVRFIPNPFYIDELKTSTGLSENVYNYVHSFDITKEFLSQASNLVLSLNPHYIEQDKKNLIIGIGCTGGMHRSVAISYALTQLLREKGLNVDLHHRDLILEQRSVLERFGKNS